MYTRLPILAGLILAAGLAPAADSWPGFRGPTADGRAAATGLATTWGEKENVRWKAAVHGKGWSSPVVLGERVWVTTADELLAGFSAPTAGEHFELVYHADEPIGVVISANGSEPDTVELAYLGVVPSARGRGIGTELLAGALRAIHSARIPVVTVSVDARNEPALRLYRRHGFTETGQSEVWLADLARDASAKGR